MLASDLGHGFSCPIKFTVDGGFCIICAKRMFYIDPVLKLFIMLLGFRKKMDVSIDHVLNY